MSDRVRWGILSSANIGRRVIPAIHASRNGEVAAVCSRSTERAEAFAAELNIPRAYGSYEALLADDEIDAIYIPLPNSMHAEWSIKCAEAGIPTLCEKPFASDAAEGAIHRRCLRATQGLAGGGLHVSLPSSACQSQRDRGCRWHRRAAVHQQQLHLSDQQ